MGRRGRHKAETTSQRATTDRPARVRVDDEVWRDFRHAIGDMPIASYLGQMVEAEVGRDRTRRLLGGKASGRDRSDRDDAAVPTISRFFGITIAMYFDDHGPAHFHARHADGAAKIRIDTLEVIDSTLGRRHLRFVLAWAELHQGELADNWRLARSGETLQEIEPLR